MQNIKDKINSGIKKDELADIDYNIYGYAGKVIYFTIFSNVAINVKFNIDKTIHHAKYKI